MSRIGPCARAALAALFVWAWSAWPAWAGDGSITAGKLDLLVYFAYEETDPASWEPVFTEYSQLLSNATEGGVQLGTVAFTQCAELKADADVWILDDSSGARAHLNGLGDSGKHITISQLHKSITGLAIGQFGLAHESGHYLFGIYDEYKGFVGNSPGTESEHYCASSAGTVACLMDGGTTVAPNNLRTEFCTAVQDGFPGTSHFTGATNANGQGVVTDQQYFLQVSCWERIEASGVGGLVAPASAPTQVEPAHDDVLFDEARLNGSLAMALVIDRSGSMSGEGRLEQAQLGAEIAIGMLEDGEFLAVIAFDDAPEIVFGAQALSAARKDRAIAEVSELVAAGGTSIGRALEAAAEELENVDGCAEFIVVVSDGISAAPNADEPSLLALLVQKGVAVYAVALGSFADECALNAAASETGGAFHRAESAEDLPGIFAAIVAQASGASTVGELSGGDLLGYERRSFGFDVPAGSEALELSLAHDPGAALEFVLVSPDGTAIDPDALPGGATRYQSAVQDVIDLPAPASGTWAMEVFETAGVASGFDLHAAIDAPALDLTATAALAEVPYPAPMQLSQGVVYGVPVAGASVTARVTRPDGTWLEDVFQDDGLSAHGDARAGDGIYSLFFSRYAGSGTYTFDVTVANVDGTAASNLECGVHGDGEDGQAPGSIPPFTAYVTHAIVLVDAPALATSGGGSLAAHAADVPPEGVDVASAAATPVGGFALDVAPEEPLALESLALSIEESSGDLAELVGMALHLDADGDGALDIPSVPIAVAELDRAAGQLWFDLPAAPLAVLEAGGRQHFLLTLGTAAPGAVGGALGVPPPRLAPPERDALLMHPERNALLGLAVLLALLALFSRSSPRSGCRRGRRARAGFASGLAAAALVAACAPSELVPGSGGAFEEPGSSRRIELRLAPQEVELVGAVTQARIATGGEPVAFVFGLR